LNSEITGPQSETIYTEHKGQNQEVLCTEHKGLTKEIFVYAGYRILTQEKFYTESIKN
jgi:hypothetical protein